MGFFPFFVQAAVSSVHCWLGSLQKLHQVHPNKLAQGIGAGVLTLHCLIVPIDVPDELRQKAHLLLAQPQTAPGVDVDKLKRKNRPPCLLPVQADLGSTTTEGYFRWRELSFFISAIALMVVAASEVTSSATVKLSHFRREFLSWSQKSVRLDGFKTTCWPSTMPLAS
mmetsp:Transcript_7981/g.22881  ORF Transcript_7981/g.22881 Transcript_7981/m.22881 type:complete len:168 (+) Transcript_7981:455-958(+)